MDSSLILITFIASGVGIMKCSKKLGIDKGWMAFIPVLQSWLVGKMAEKCDAIERPEKKARKWSMINAVLTAIGLCSLFVMAIIDAILALIISAITGGAGILSTIYKIGSLFIDSSVKEKISPVAIVLIIIAILIFAVAMILILVAAIVDYFLMYKVFKRFAPSRAGLFLLLSIVTSLAEAVIWILLGFMKRFDPLKDVPPQGAAPAGEQAYVGQGYTAGEQTFTPQSSGGGEAQ